MGGVQGAGAQGAGQGRAGAGQGRGWGEGEEVVLDRQKNRCLLQNSLEIDLRKSPQCSLENSDPIFGLRGEKSL